MQVWKATGTDKYIQQPRKGVGHMNKKRKYFFLMSVYFCNVNPHSTEANVHKYNSLIKLKV